MIFMTLHPSSMHHLYINLMHLPYIEQDSIFVPSAPGDGRWTAWCDKLDTFPMSWCWQPNCKKSQIPSL